MKSRRRMPRPGGDERHRIVIRDTIDLLQNKFGWEVEIEDTYLTDSGVSVRPDIIGLPPDALRRKGERKAWIEIQQDDVNSKTKKCMESYYDGLSRIFSEPLVIDLERVWDNDTFKRRDKINEYLDIRYEKWKRR